MHADIRFQNKIVVAIIHAMLGAVTADLRAVYFESCSDSLYITFVVYVLSPEVTEAIDAIGYSIASQELKDTSIVVRTLVLHKQELLSVLASQPRRFVYLRKSAV